MVRRVLDLLLSRPLARAFAVVGAMVFMTTPAHAYIDPGTGGMLLQLLLGGLAGAAVIVRLQWERIRETTRRLFSLRGQTDDDDKTS